jgi:hypothetical protein
MQRFYFFFSNSQTSWISRLFKRGYQHVELVGEIGDFVFHTNPRWGRVDYAITNTYTLASVIEQLKARGHTVVMYRCEIPDPQARIMRGPLITCATYLAYTIGLSFRGVTPHQLYKTLKARGGVDV